MNNPAMNKKPYRIILYYDAVGDYDGAFNYVPDDKYNEPEYSLGMHKGTYPSDTYFVVELVPLDEEVL